MIAELLADAGLPAGVLNVVTGDQEVGERLVAHPGTAMIHFTGSSAVGSRIAEAPARSSSASRSSSAATTRWSSSRTPTSTRRR